MTLSYIIYINVLSSIINIYIENEIQRQIVTVTNDDADYYGIERDIDTLL